jgi:dolichol-phosphate mannosyltransferase
MEKIPLISVVFSFRNEEQTLPELIRRVENTLDPLKIEYELIFVSDASTDRSNEILLNRLKEDRHIKIINMSRRFGNSQCSLAGIRYARGDAVIYMDVDLQDPPELLPQLLEKWQEGYDVVYTTRTHREGESAIKMWLTKVAYRVLRFASEIPFPVDSGDFKLLSRRVVNEVIKLNEYDPFMRFLVSWVGFKQTAVFYRRRKRFAGKTHFPFLGLAPVKAFVSALTAFSTLPLSLLLIIGLTVSFGAFIYLLLVVIMVILGIGVSKWVAFVAAMVFLGGMQLFGIGIVGLYLGRVYSEVKNRPVYIVESTYGFEGQPKQEG